MQVVCTGEHRYEPAGGPAGIATALRDAPETHLVQELRRELGGDLDGYALHGDAAVSHALPRTIYHKI